MNHLEKYEFVKAARFAPIQKLGQGLYNLFRPKYGAKAVRDAVNRHNIVEYVPWARTHQGAMRTAQVARKARTPTEGYTFRPHTRKDQYILNKRPYTLESGPRTNWGSSSKPYYTMGGQQTAGTITMPMTMSRARALGHTPPAGWNPKGVDDWVKYVRRHEMTHAVRRVKNPANFDSFGTSLKPTFREEFLANAGGSRNLTHAFNFTAKNQMVNPTYIEGLHGTSNWIKKPILAGFKGYSNILGKLPQRMYGGIKGWNRPNPASYGYTA